MKHYPSIPSEVRPGEYIYAFDKIDGSNIRSEWSKKQGCYKFGSRNRLLGEDQPIIYKAKELILKYEDEIGKLCKDQKWESIILFWEFAGPNSAFGNHIEDDEHKVWLIDANPYKKGILPPKDFISLFGDFNPAPCLYQGYCDNDFVQSVRNSSLEGMGSEGVVCKTAKLMFKIKADSWYARLKEHCGDNEKLFEQLK